MTATNGMLQGSALFSLLGFAGVFLNNAGLGYAPMIVILTAAAALSGWLRFRAKPPSPHQKDLALGLGIPSAILALVVTARAFS